MVFLVTLGVPSCPANGDRNTDLLARFVLGGHTTTNAFPWARILNFPPGYTPYGITTSKRSACPRREGGCDRSGTGDRNLGAVLEWPAPLSRLTWMRWPGWVLGGHVTKNFSQFTSAIKGIPENTFGGTTTWCPPVCVVKDGVG